MIACSRSFILYSTHPFFPWVPERRMVMSRCQFGLISMIVNRFVSESIDTKKRRNFIMQILRRFLAKS
jgi:hypothetical protein